MSLWVPVYLDGEIYQNKDFVLKVNKGYIDGRRQHGDYRRGRPVYEEFTDAVALDKHKNNSLFVSDKRDCKLQFGIDDWTAKFNCFISEYGKRYLDGWQTPIDCTKNRTPNTDCISTFYIKKFLLADLQEFARKFSCDHSVDLEKISDYPSYISACFNLKYCPKYDLRWISESGWGIYALQEIYPFTFLGIYGGKLRLRLWSRLSEFCRGYTNHYKWRIAEAPNYLIDAEKKGSLLRFMNHDRKRTRRAEPIVLFDQIKIPHRGLIAGTPERKRYAESLMTFLPGDEVVWDYGYNVYIK